MERRRRLQLKLLLWSYEVYLKLKNILARSFSFTFIHLNSKKKKLDPGILSQRNWKPILDYSKVFEKKNCPLSLYSFWTAIRGEAGCRCSISSQENWQALSSFLLLLLLPWRIHTCLAFHTKEHVFNQRMFCLFWRGITEKFHEVLCSIVPEKVIFGTFWSQRDRHTFLL